MNQGQISYLGESQILFVYHPTPVSEIDHPVIRKAGLKLLVKREYLNHPEISGNKFWKLKHNLGRALHLKQKTILTFGGAYSNHIYATAAATRAAGLECIGIIRGEETVPLNPTLQFAADHGMRLHYVSRTEYLKKDTLPFLQKLRADFGDHYLIPEGGTNDLALKGCEEFGIQLDTIAADYICLPVGTGGTMGGIVRSISPPKTVIGFSILKNGGFLRDKIKEYAGHSAADWQLITDYSYGGYGKRNKTVTDFIKTAGEYINLPLDFVYTGKMMCAVFDLVEKGFFKEGKTILVVHTGGLQGQSD